MVFFLVTLGRPPPPLTAYIINLLSEVHLTVCSPLIDPHRLSLIYACRNRPHHSFHIPHRVRPQEAAGDGGRDRRDLRLLREVLRPAAGDQVRRHLQLRRVKHGVKGKRVQMSADVWAWPRGRRKHISAFAGMRSFQLLIILFVSNTENRRCR